MEDKLTTSILNDIEGRIHAYKIKHSRTHQNVIPNLSGFKITFLNVRKQETNCL